jgi:sortase A
LSERRRGDAWTEASETANSRETANSGDPGTRVGRAVEHPGPGAEHRRNGFAENGVDRSGRRSRARMAPPRETSDEAHAVGRAPAPPDRDDEDPSPVDRTAIIPKLRDVGPDPGADGPVQPPKGMTVIPLRPLRTDDGYKSVYSEVTRTTPGTVVRSIARGTGELLITLGLVVLLFAAYEVWGKAVIVNAEQHNLDEQLSQEWNRDPGAPSTPASSAPALPPPEGKAIARLYIPKMKKNWIIVEGVKQADIRYAPGHYPDTADAGQVGNFSVAGHRTRSIFWDLDVVQPGDMIIVETKTEWFIYKTTQNHVVLPNAVEVVAAVPGQPKAKPTKRMLTLTTCNPKFNNYQRLIIHAELLRTEPHTANQQPAEIGG